MLTGFSHQWKQQEHWCRQQEWTGAFTANLSALPLPNPPQMAPVWLHKCNHTVGVGCRHRLRRHLLSYHVHGKLGCIFTPQRHSCPVPWGQGSAPSQRVCHLADRLSVVAGRCSSFRRPDRIPVCNGCKAVEDGGATKILLTHSYLRWFTFRTQHQSDFGMHQIVPKHRGWRNGREMAQDFKPSYLMPVLALCQLSISHHLSRVTHKSLNAFRIFLFRMKV